MMVIPTIPTRVGTTNQSPQSPVPVAPMSSANSNKLVPSPVAPSNALPVIMALPKDLYKKKRFHREKKMRMRRSLSLPSAKKHQQRQQQQRHQQQQHHTSQPQHHHQQQDQGGVAVAAASTAPLSPDRWGTNTRSTSLTRSRSSRKTSRPIVSTSFTSSATTSAAAVASSGPALGRSATIPQPTASTATSSRFTEGQTKRDSSIRLPKRQRSCSPAPSSPTAVQTHQYSPSPLQRSKSNVETVMDLIDTVLDQLSVDSNSTGTTNDLSSSNNSSSRWAHQ